MFNSFSRMFLLLPLIMVSNTDTFSQEPLQINSPFDSLVVINPVATGDRGSGRLTIKMDIENRFPKEIWAHLRLGNYDDLGVVDLNGRKYKNYTIETPPGHPEVNKGYLPIDSVGFGYTTNNVYVFMDKHISTGRKLPFTIVIDSYPMDNRIPLLQFTCVLIRKKLYRKEGHFELRNIPIQWEQETSGPINLRVEDAEN